MNPFNGIESESDIEPEQGKIIYESI